MTTYRTDPHQRGSGPKQNPYGGPVWYEDPKKADADIDIERVVLDIVNNTKKLRDLDITEIIMDGEIFQTMDGASTITLSLHDPGMELIRTGIFNRAIDVEIDNLVWRLVSVTKRDDYLDLVFEDRIISWLKGKKKVKRASRNKMTRLEFCYSLTRAVRTKKIRVVVPELQKKMSIASTDEEKEEVKERTVGGLNVEEDTDVLSGERGPQGLPVPGQKRTVGTAPHLTVKGVRANKSQIRVLEEILRTGADMDVSPKLLLAAIMVVIQESLAGQQNVSVSGRHVGPFHQETGQTIWAKRGGAIPGNSNKAVRGGAKAFFMRAQELDERFKTAAELAEGVQVAGTPAAWAAHKEEAEKIVAAFSGELGTTVTRTYRKRYSFSTEDGGKAQNYWAAMKRLLDEVNFACFTANGILYLISENQLMKSKKKMVFGFDTPGINDIDFTWDVEQSEASATVYCRITRWLAPPGTVVQLKDCGPASADGGRWLVESIRRGLYSRDAEIALKKPEPKLPEPAPEIGTRDSRSGPIGESGTASGDDVYDVALHISNATPGYLYGGGHGVKLKDIDPATDRLDCSSSTSLVLYRTKMYENGGSTAQVSGWFASSWGKKGRGSEFTVWANASHVFIQSEGQGRKWRFDTGGPGGGSGPKIHYEHRSTSGFTPRYLPTEDDSNASVE